MQPAESDNHIICDSRILLIFSMSSMFFANSVWRSVSFGCENFENKILLLTIISPSMFVVNPK